MKLLIQVCRAVQHAHQKGIIHRDLKPSNVLVADVDGTAVPKVIDFGVAKATGQKLADETIYTHFSQMVGTPMYMSPEQAQMGVTDVDTRSDVYSLGVLTYELLTGCTPFDPDTMRHANHVELQRMIREDNPPRPSARISTIGSQHTSTVSVSRGVTTRMLSTLLRGELDWIVMKALEKNREHRYSSALALAEDIEKYLAGEPVEAGPPSRSYRFRKFAQRHRAALLTTLLVALVLLAGIVGTAWKSHEAQHERDRAIAAEAAARTAEREQRRLREEAELREFALRDMVYASDVRMASQAWKVGDIRQCADLLTRSSHLGGSDMRGFEWGLLRSFTAARFRVPSQLLSTNSLARFLGNGTHFVAAGHKLMLYDANTELPTRKFSGHSATINGIDLSPDGTTLASIGDDGKVRLWSMADGRQTDAFDADAGHGHRVYFVLDGQILVTSGEEPKVKLWDRQTLRQIGEFSGFSEFKHQGVKGRLAPSPDRRRLVAADGNITARVYDIADKTTLCELDLKEHGFIRCIGFSPDGRFIAGGRANHVVTVWDSETGEALRQLEGHLDDVQDVAFHPDGLQLASADRAGLVRFWNLQDLRDDEAQLPERQRQWPSQFIAHDDRIWTLDFSPNGDRLITACRDDSIRIWPGQQRQQLRIEGTAIDPRVAWFDASTLVLTTDASLVFWDLTTGHKQVSERFEDRVQSLDISPNRKWIATGHAHGVTRLWNAETRTVNDSWVGHENIVHCLAFSRDGSRLASGGEDGKVLIRDAKSGHVIREFQHDYRCISAAFSPNGRILAVAMQNDILIHNLSTGSVEHLRGHLNSADCLAFSPDGRWLASGSDDRTIRIWNSSDFSVTHVIHAHKHKIESLAFSPDGRTLASGDKGGVVAFSRVGNGRLLYDLSLEPYWNKNIREPWVSDLSFSHDGNQLAAAMSGLGILILESDLSDREHDRAPDSTPTRYVPSTL